jgi:hypothetical protein
MKVLDVQFFKIKVIDSAVLLFIMGLNVSQEYH